jgi:hypothetical protein
LIPTSGGPGTAFDVSGDDLTANTAYGIYWDSGGTFISGAVTDGVGHFEGITHTVPITATSGIYIVTAQLEDNVKAAAPFEVP